MVAGSVSVRAAVIAGGCGMLWMFRSLGFQTLPVWLNWFWAFCMILDWLYVVPGAVILGGSQV